jgi:hypothetical protein
MCLYVVLHINETFFESCGINTVKEFKLIALLITENKLKPNVIVCVCFCVHEHVYVLNCISYVIHYQM